ncbi:hypothetical protein KKE14_00420 [Patescibacteria group bacterium]|nr:hypothetical protein [Patescibacteria group bacterium]
MDAKTIDIIEESFYFMCDDKSEKSGMLTPEWEFSIGLPVTPCFGEINRQDLPTIVVYNNGMREGWYAPPDESIHT